MLPDPHRLLFYSYGGEADNPLRIRQLENNVTRALINTFERVSARTRAKLLALIDPSLARLDAGDVRFGLQRALPESSTIRRRYLVTLTGRLPEEMAGALPHVERHGHPDGWVHLPDASAAVAFESKLGDSLPTQTQLAGHLRALGWARHVQLRHLDWAAVASRALDVSKQGTDVDRLLTEELAHYLEALGMASLRSWSDTDFEALAGGEKERGYTPILRRRLEDFANMVRDNLPREIRKRYSNVRVGHVHPSRREAWATIRQDKDDKNPLNNCNFAIALRPGSLRGYAVIRDGRATEPRKALGIFYRAVRARPDAFVRVLRASGDRFRFIVAERTGPDGKGSPRRGADYWDEWLNLRSKEPGDAFVPYLIHLLERIPFPGIRYGPVYESREALDAKAPVLAKQVAGELATASALLDFVNDAR